MSVTQHEGTSASPVRNRFLEGSFAPVTEEITAFDLPVTFNKDAASAGRKLPYMWNPSHQPRVGLLPRDGSSGDVRWLEVDPFHGSWIPDPAGDSEDRR